jgi:hypothetical protein
MFEKFRAFLLQSSAAQGIRSGNDKGRKRSPASTPLIDPSDAAQFHAHHSWAKKTHGRNHPTCSHPLFQAFGRTSQKSLVLSVPLVLFSGSKAKAFLDATTI